VLKGERFEATISGMTTDQALALDKARLKVYERKMNDPTLRSLERRMAERQYEMQLRTIKNMEKAMQKRDVPKVKKLTDSQKRQLNTLVRAIRFNRGLDESTDFKVSVVPNLEVSQYRLGMTQLTLPQRFGLYKTPTKGVPTTTMVELDNPSNELLDESSVSEFVKNHPNHKVRGIFD
jgi:hypothetical protein